MRAVPKVDVANTDRPLNKIDGVRELLAKNLIAGIVHAAGLVADRTIANSGPEKLLDSKLTYDSCAKIDGANNVLAFHEEALKAHSQHNDRASRPQPFCVLCSSSSVLLGAGGQASYCFVNQYMDVV